MMFRLQAGICSSMTESVLEKLRSAGIANVVDFVSHDLDVLATKSGVGYRELAAIRRFLISEHAAPVVVGSSLFDSIVATASIVSVGCRALDDMLDGGIFTGEITEAVTDRSHLSDALVMNAVLAVVTTMCKNVVVVDASNRFDVRHLAAMLASQPNTDVQSALKQVRVVRCFDVLEVLAGLSAVCEAAGTSTDSFCSSLKLIVIDGIVDCILPSLSHIHNNAGCGYIAQLAHQFRLLSTEFCYAVLLCNGNGHTPMSKNSSVTKPTTSVGRLWCSVADTRLDVTDITSECNEQCGTDSRKVYGQIKVTRSKSNRLPIGNCVKVEVNEQGLFI